MSALCSVTFLDPTFTLTNSQQSHPYSLATENDHVRSRLAEYGNDLLSLGADGLRIDAAKRGQLSQALRIYS